MIQLNSWILFSSRESIQLNSNLGNRIWIISVPRPDVSDTSSVLCLWPALCGGVLLVGQIWPGLPNIWCKQVANEPTGLTVKITYTTHNTSEFSKYSSISKLKEFSDYWLFTYPCRLATNKPEKQQDSDSTIQENRHANCSTDRLLQMSLLPDGKFNPPVLNTYHCSEWWR